MTVNRGTRYIGGLAVAGLSAVSALTAAAHPATAATGQRTERVIVVLRDQAGHGQRLENAVLARLPGPAPRHVSHYSLADAFAAVVDPAQLTELAGDPAVASVSQDALIIPSRAPRRTLHRAERRATPAADPSSFAVCPSDPAQPLVEPEALGSIKAFASDGSPYAQQLATGSGVRVAVIADGLDPNAPDFITPGGEHVISDYQDFSGDGPASPTGDGEAFGAVSAIAAQGTATYDLSDFVNPDYPLPAGCNITLRGVAPGASIDVLKAGDGISFTTSAVLQALDYAVSHDHVSVIDEGFTTTALSDSGSRNAIALFNDHAVADGVTVTTAAGDGGPVSGPSRYAADPHVISVGASTDHQLAAQTGEGGARAFSNGTWLDDNIAPSSAGGGSQLGRTVDLVAPGDDDWAACSPSFDECEGFGGHPSDLQRFGGTQESVALAAGAAALVISAYRSTHKGHSPSPAVVKSALTGTATDLDVPSEEQGAGLLNARAATQAALTWPGASTAPPAGVTATVVPSRDQVAIVGQAGKSASASVTIRNVGRTSVKVATATRGFATSALHHLTTSFSATTLPTYPDAATGVPTAYQRVTFSVPAGVAQLVTRLDWAGTSGGNTGAPLALALFSPGGAAAATSGSQSTTNYATASVRSPAVGTWTALLSSPAGAAGYTGTAGLEVDAVDANPAGTVTPSTFTLGAGKSRSVRVRIHLPKRSSGDADHALTIATSAGQQSAVALIARTLVGFRHGNGAFAGVLTGGDGAPGIPAETSSYSFTVPTHTAGLDAGLRFESLPGTTVDLALIDPHHVLADLASNQIETASHHRTESSKVQAFAAAPTPGRWTLVVVAQNPASGTALRRAFSGMIRLHQLRVKRASLPHSFGTTLKRGAAHVVRLKVTNSGSLPVFVGLDARRGRLATVAPAPFAGLRTFAIPPSSAQEPAFVVPPDTTSMTVTASSTEHAQIEVRGPGGGDDVLGSLSAARHGTLSTAKVTEPRGSYLPRGEWTTNVHEIGPFGDSAPTGTSTVTASMRTLGFDPTVTSTLVDPFRQDVSPTHHFAGSAREIPAGRTVVITLRLTPRAHPGRKVSGVLNLVTAPLPATSDETLPLGTTGEVVAAIGYRYTVKAHHHH